MSDGRLTPPVTARDHAAGPDDETKQWLREYIAERKDTPEVRQIRALLHQAQR